MFLVVDQRIDVGSKTSRGGGIDTGDMVVNTRLEESADQKKNSEQVAGRRLIRRT